MDKVDDVKRYHRCQEFLGYMQRYKSERLLLHYVHARQSYEFLKHQIRSPDVRASLGELEVKVLGE